MNKKIHSRQYLKEFRSTLRKNLTPAEAVLWKAIRGGQLLGRKFRRQHSIENFIVDFYCPEERLIIELDGQVHFRNGAHFADADRDKRFNELGFRVIRFENKFAFKHLEEVLETIASHFH